jgi:hypothetical protein
MRPPDEIRQLAAAARGLLYPSETDAPLTPFRLPASAVATAGDAVRAHASDASAAIQQVAVDDFFAELLASDEGDRWRRLRAALEAAVTGLEVWRCGSRRVEVYLIGKARSGQWAGLRTISVET